MSDVQFEDARTAALYDEHCSGRDDTGFYVEPATADLVVMTGHVAQVFTDEASWRSVLAGVHRALRPGGRLAFEVRNPAARAWEAWTPEASRVSLAHPTDGPVTAWVETTRARHGMVTLVWRYRFEDSGDVVVSESTLRFPSRVDVEWSLSDCGFALEATYGDWDGSPLGVRSPEMVFVARKGDAA